MLVNILIVTNLIFNIFFGLVCAFITIEFVKKNKKIKNIANATRKK